MWGTVAIVLTVIVVIGIALVVWLRSQAVNQASDLAKQLFPVWAAQGPFDSGAESAAAMRNAYLAVLGANQTEEMADAIEGHETAYDANPETWEETRRTTLEGASSDALTLAEGIAAAERLNTELIEGGGQRLQFTRQPDGSVGLVNKQIWSDEAIDKKKKQDNEAITSGIGNGLISDSSLEAQALVVFLSDVYRANTDEEPDASAIGKAWLAFVAMRDEEPDSELVETFQKLNDAHLANLDESESSDLG